MSQVVSAVMLVVFVVLIVVIFGRMFYRLGKYVFVARRRPDVLLVRDLVLFAAFAVIFGLSLIFRTLDVSVADNLYWTLFAGFVVNAALGYWAYVEYRVVDSPLRPSGRCRATSDHGPDHRVSALT